MIKRVLAGLFAFVLSTIVSSAVWAEPVVVGQTSAPYALAYSTARHVLFYKGWWVSYHDGTNFVAAYSKDGQRFDAPIVVSHIPAAVCCAAYLVNGEMVFLYSDTSYQYVFVRKGRFFSGKLVLDKPAPVGSMGNSFTAMAPTLAVDDRGIAWVAARTNVGDNHFNIWISRSLDVGLTQWSPKQYISSEEEVQGSSAGTSGLMICAGRWHLVLVCDNPTLWSIARNVRWDWAYSLLDTPYLWERMVMDAAFAGVHDVSVVVQNDVVYAAYVQRDNNNNSDTRMVIRSRPPDGVWGAAEPIGVSGIHTTALGRDRNGTLYAFYSPTDGKIWVRTRAIDASEWTPGRAVWEVPKERLAPYLWLAASDEKSDGVGICWEEEREKGIYTVLFMRVDS